MQNAELEEPVSAIKDCFNLTDVLPNERQPIKYYIEESGKMLKKRYNKKVFQFLNKFFEKFSLYNIEPNCTIQLCRRFIAATMRIIATYYTKFDISKKKNTMPLLKRASNILFLWYKQIIKLLVDCNALFLSFDYNEVFNQPQIEIQQYLNFLNENVDPNSQQQQQQYDFNQILLEQQFILKLGDKILNLQLITKELFRKQFSDSDQSNIQQQIRDFFKHSIKILLQWFIYYYKTQDLQRAIKFIKISQKLFDSFNIFQLTPKLLNVCSQIFIQKQVLYLEIQSFEESIKQGDQAIKLLQLELQLNLGKKQVKDANDQSAMIKGQSKIINCIHFMVIVIWNQCLAAEQLLQLSFLNECLTFSNWLCKSFLQPEDQVAIYNEQMYKSAQVKYYKFIKEESEIVKVLSNVIEIQNQDQNVKTLTAQEDFLSYLDEKFYQQFNDTLNQNQFVFLTEKQVYQSDVSKNLQQNNIQKLKLLQNAAKQSVILSQQQMLARKTLKSIHQDEMYNTQSSENSISTANNRNLLTQTSQEDNNTADVTNSKQIDISDRNITNDYSGVKSTSRQTNFVHFEDQSIQKQQQMQKQQNDFKIKNKKIGGYDPYLMKNYKPKLVTSDKYFLEYNDITKERQKREKDIMVNSIDDLLLSDIRNINSKQEQQQSSTLKKNVNNNGKVIRQQSATNFNRRRTVLNDNNDQLIANRKLEQEQGEQINQIQLDYYTKLIIQQSFDQKQKFLKFSEAYERGQEQQNGNLQDKKQISFCEGMISMKERFSIGSIMHKQQEKFFGHYSTFLAEQEVQSEGELYLNHFLAQKQREKRQKQIEEIKKMKQIMQSFGLHDLAQEKPQQGKHTDTTYKNNKLNQKNKENNKKSQHDDAVSSNQQQQQQSNNSHTQFQQLARMAKGQQNANLNSTTQLQRQDSKTIQESIKLQQSISASNIKDHINQYESNLDEMTQTIKQQRKLCSKRSLLAKISQSDKTTVPTDNNNNTNNEIEPIIENNQANTESSQNLINKNSSLYIDYNSLAKSAGFYKQNKKYQSKQFKKTILNLSDFKKVAQVVVQTGVPQNSLQKIKQEKKLKLSLVGMAKLYKNQLNAEKSESYQ